MTPSRVWALALALSLAPLWARAEEAAGAGGPLPMSRVILLQLEGAQPDRAWPAAERRIAAEVGAAGLEAVVASVEATEEGARVAELARAAREHDAVAGVAVARGPDGATVLVWLEGGALRRRLAEEQLDAPGAVGEVALSVTELLHGRFLRIRPSAAEPEPAHPGWDEVAPAEPREVEPREVEPPAASEPPPPRAEEGPPPTLLPPPVHALVYPPRRSMTRWSLRAGPAAVVPVDPAGVMMSISLGGSLRVLEWLCLDVDGLVSFLPQKMTTWEHEGRLWAATFRAHVTFDPFPRSAVRPAIGVGGGTLVTWSRGESDACCDSESDATAVGLLSLLVRLVVPVTASVRLLAAARVGLAIPEVDLRLAGEHAGTLGAPLVDVTLGVEIGLGRWPPSDS